MSYTNFTWENANPNEDAGSTGSTFGMAIGMAPIYPLFIRDGQGNIMKDVNGYNRYDFGNGQNAGLTALMRQMPMLSVPTFSTLASATETHSTEQVLLMSSSSKTSP